MPRRCRRRLAYLVFPLLAAVAVVLPLRAVRAQETTLPFSAPNPDALRRVLPSADMENLPGGFVVVTPSAQTSLRPVIETRYRGTFSRAVWVYGTRAGQAGMTRLVTVHHEPGQTAQARRAARLCARLLRLHFDRFQRDAAFPRGSVHADVWLVPDAPPSAPGIGGETRADQVYVFATASAPRTALEWVRTLAHEWGHLTLPAARGFTDPESDASGYLGERLYLKWLREDALRRPALSADDGTETGDLALYYRRQILPLMERFAKAGPNAKTMNGTDGAAMDLYIGGVLASDEAFGAALLGRALFTILDVRPRDFFAALEKTVAAAAPRALVVRLPAWVPMEQTQYTITPGPDSGSGSLVLADRPPLAVGGGGKGREPATLQVRIPGWKWMRAASADDLLRTIVLHRRRDASRRAGP